MSRIMTFYHRRLPHWHPPGQDIFITWRLHGSLPGRAVPPSVGSSPGQAFVHYDRILDAARTGPLWLKDSRVAESILSALSSGQKKEMFRVHTYALMANHIHILLTPTLPVPRITQLIKGATARQANLILDRTNTHFWQDESFDHWVRNPAEWEKIRGYIERNPVAAGLVARPQDWPWSSASRPLD